jgi:sec-independent protein translocase protein TatB
MFDLGWTELMLIGIVALIVVGPKDLPNMFRAVGQFMGKARGMAREFSRAMEAAADDAGVKDINKTLRAATAPMSFGADKLREAAGLKSPAGMAAPGTPIATVKPGGATEALAAEKKAKREQLEADVQARAVARRAEAAPTVAPAPTTEIDPR